MRQWGPNGTNGMDGTWAMTIRCQDIVSRTPTMITDSSPGVPQVWIQSFLEQQVHHSLIQESHRHSQTMMIMMMAMMVMMATITAMLIWLKIWFLVPKQSRLSDLASPNYMNFWLRCKAHRTGDSTPSISVHLACSSLRSLLHTTVSVCCDDS